MLIVQKFGGTCVGTPARILSVADRIAEGCRRGDKTVVVVSAMGHSTDELESLAFQISKRPSPREMDMLLSTGERISMALLSMALHDRGVEALSFTGSQSGIITDGSHQGARIKKVLGLRIREALEKGKTPIVAGFQGVSEGKEITTLGRGGSDTTAVALAVALGADECQIFTDVDGVYSCDPNKNPKARFFAELSSPVMYALAHWGAQVLHPRSVALAQKYGIRLSVRNGIKNFKETSGKNGGGTTMAISHSQVTGDLESPKIVAVTSNKGFILARAELARPTVACSFLDTVLEKGLRVMGPMVMGDRLSVFLEKAAESEWLTILNRLVEDGFVKKYDLAQEVVPVTVIGECLGHGAEVSCRILDLLAKKDIFTEILIEGPQSITVAVKSTQVDEAVASLHDSLIA